MYGTNDIATSPLCRCIAGGPGELLEARSRGLRRLHVNLCVAANKGVRDDGQEE